MEPQATHNVVVSFGPNAPKEVGELLNVHVFIKNRFNKWSCSEYTLYSKVVSNLAICYRNNWLSMPRLSVKVFLILQVQSKQRRLIHLNNKE